MNARMRKLLCLVLALALCLTAVAVPALALGDTAGETATRRTVAAALWELAGRPETGGSLPFTDVSPEAEGAEAIRWAASAQIADGVGDGLFLPEGPVSREQLATMLYRYAKSAGMDVTVDPDAAAPACSDWAVPALRWAVGADLLTPGDAYAPLTRGDTAAALQAFAGLLSAAAGQKDAALDGYTLEQVVVLSRHNIRSPLSGAGSVLGDATPHTWFNWTSGTSELSLRGGALETVMGQYFRKYLVSEGLFTENEVPAAGEVRFYANAKQRTIATARYFSTGMFPIAGAEIETHAAYDTMDPVFEPRLTYVTDAYREAALAQIGEMGGENGLAGLGERVKDSYDLIAGVLDLRDSKAYADGTLTGFATDDTQILLDLYKEPAMKGSLKTATSISDALVLQYYEEADPVKAAFGKTLTLADWKAISAVKDLYGDVLFTAPLVAVNVANPLVRELQSELNTAGRKFSFLCGHDSNVGSVLAALGAEDYTAPFAIEAKTPIGVKLVFEKWAPKSGEGETLVSLRLVYQSVQQLRNLSLLTPENPPVSFPVCLEGLTQRGEGVYALSDLMARMDETVAAYEKLPELYGAMEAEAA